MSGTMKSETLKYTIANRKLTGDEADLHELANLAGVVMDPSVFRIILDLLRLNVAPTAIERMLKTMTGGRRSRGAAPDDSSTSSSRGSSVREQTSKSRLNAAPR